MRDLFQPRIITSTRYVHIDEHLDLFIEGIIIFNNIYVINNNAVAASYSDIIAIMFSQFSQYASHNRRYIIVELNTILQRVCSFN